MVLSITSILAFILLIVLLAKRRRDGHEMERHSITLDALHALMASKQEVQIVDVRQPLDMLGESVIIPGAQWIPPEVVRANPSLLRRKTTLSSIALVRVTRLAAPSCIGLSPWDSCGSNF